MPNKPVMGDGGAPGPDAAGAQAADDIVDAEFEEVKDDDSQPIAD